MSDKLHRKLQLTGDVTGYSQIIAEGLQETTTYQQQNLALNDAP